MSHDHEQRVRAVAAFPHELSAYREWLAAHPKERSRDYLFADKRTRFEPKRQDVVVATGTLTVSTLKDRTVVSCADPAITIPLPDTTASDARRVIEMIDGERCLLEVQLDSGLAPVALARVLRATFGRVILASEAVDALERRISGLEIARFPGSPYAIMRAYWNNMAAVRERIPAEIPKGPAFVELLRNLHVTTLMGEALDSFYKPASPGADSLVAPGGLFLEPVVVRNTKRGALFLSGPRVNAKLIGGEAYHHALYASVHDLPALSRTDALVEADVPWGSVVVARSERESEPTPWFCPPRPITEAHFATLRGHLDEAFLATSHALAIAAAARFHWCGVRLHAFHNGNQSLVMNLVNAALVRQGGLGIPHLVLDHFALRLRLEAYVRLFERAVATYGMPGDATSRRTRLRVGNDASYRFIGKVNNHPAEALDALIADDEAGASFALLV